MKQIVLGITGASGARYARRLIEVLIGGGGCVHAIVSPHGAELMKLELGIEAVTPQALAGPAAQNLVLHRHDDLMDPLASGSVPTDGMAICPCSANTLSAVAAGLGDNLITRAAHVHLKERRTLVLVPREMPVSAIDLENQARLARAGAIIAPACPAFYLHPATIDDLVDFVAARVARCLGVRHGPVGQYGTLE